jgi:hypothetical protein
MLAPQRSGTAQLFFDIGHGFVESDSVRATVIGGDVPNVYRFPLPASVSGAPRFDPVDRGKRDIVLQDARIIQRGGRVLKKLPPLLFKPNQNIEAMQVLGRDLRLHLVLFRFVSVVSFIDFCRSFCWVYFSPGSGVSWERDWRAWRRVIREERFLLSLSSAPS